MSEHLTLEVIQALLDFEPEKETKVKLTYNANLKKSGV